MNHPPFPPHDDRPEHIHMVVCGVGFFAFYGVLRLLYLGHALASVVTLVAAFPLMYILLPISAFIYGVVSKPETRRTNVHVTDAGCSTLVFLLLVLLMISVLENAKSGKQHTKTTTTQHR